VDQLLGCPALKRQHFLLALLAAVVSVSVSSTIAQSIGESPVAPNAVPAPVPATPPSPLGAAAAAPPNIRIEPVAPFRLESSGPPSWSYWVPVVGPLFSGLLAFLGAWFGLSIAKHNTLRTIETTQKASEASIWQKANESEFKEQIEKLDRFYGPFIHMSETNRLLALDFRSRQPEGFRTLIAVFDRSWVDSLSSGDRKLLDEVCQNAAKLQKFIEERTGMVDEKVMPYLALASHFRILHLAYGGELGIDPTHFAHYVYPRQLDKVIQLEVDRLRRRCDFLRENPSAPPGPMPALQIPPELALDPLAAAQSSGWVAEHLKSLVWEESETLRPIILSHPFASSPGGYPV
jgi:hypothetical protein